MKLIASSAFALGLVAAILIFSGCSAAGEGPEEPPAFTFWPTSPEAWDDFELASDRIEKVAGFRPYAGISQERTIVYLDSGAPDDTCALTTSLFNHKNGDWIDSDVELWEGVDGCFDDTSVELIHEMIHAMRDAILGNIRGTNEHSEFGLFAPRAGDVRFEATSLAMLCETGLCTSFNPEE